MAGYCLHQRHFGEQRRDLLDSCKVSFKSICSSSPLGMKGRVRGGALLPGIYYRQRRETCPFPFFFPSSASVSHPVSRALLLQIVPSRISPFTKELAAIYGRRIDCVGSCPRVVNYFKRVTAKGEWTLYLFVLNLSLASYSTDWLTLEDPQPLRLSKKKKREGIHKRRH